MAEIKIEKKKPVWPWILLILVLAALVYFYIKGDENDPMDGEVQTIDSTDTSSLSSSVEYQTYYL